ncbi:hypothetical protein YC2023_081282 [Brassica napus]
MENQLCFDPGTTPTPLSTYIQEHYEKLDLINSLPEMFVKINSEDVKHFGFDKVKEFCVSNSISENMVNSFQLFEPDKLSDQKRFQIGNDINSNLALSFDQFLKHSKEGGNDAPLGSAPGKTYMHGLIMESSKDICSLFDPYLPNHEASMYEITCRMFSTQLWSSSKKNQIKRSSYVTVMPFTNHVVFSSREFRTPEKLEMANLLSDEPATNSIIPKVIIHVLNVHESFGLDGLQKESKIDLFGPNGETDKNWLRKKYGFRPDLKETCLGPYQEHIIHFSKSWSLLYQEAAQVSNTSFFLVWLAPSKLLYFVGCASYQATYRNLSFVGLVRHIKQQLEFGSIKRLSDPLVSPFNPSQKVGFIRLLSPTSPSLQQMKPLPASVVNGSGIKVSDPSPQLPVFRTLIAMPPSSITTAGGPPALTPAPPSKLMFSRVCRDTGLGGRCVYEKN